MNTRDKILDKALQMFNERGIEYVGMRELASLLGIRVSNITYYFPTKDDLVYQLSIELSKANAAVIAEQGILTMNTFLDTLHRIFQNQVKFQCLLLSVVHLMKQNKHLAATYEKTQRARKATIRSNLQELVKGGYLNLEDEAELEFIVSGASMVSRFWLSEAAITIPKFKSKNQILHYLKMIARLLMPYATEKGKDEIENFHLFKKVHTNNN